MSCNDFDWKAYALNELSREERRSAESHASGCSACREELASLRLTLDAMSTLREEELPRRIAFVSGPSFSGGVFEPKWWQQLWNPTFASACVVAGAILVHAFAGSSATAQAQIDAAVYKAVAQVEARQAKESEQLAAYYDLMDKRVTQMYVSANGIVRQ